MSNAGSTALDAGLLVMSKLSALGHCSSNNLLHLALFVEWSLEGLVVREPETLLGASKKGFGNLRAAFLIAERKHD